MRKSPESRSCAHCHGVFMPRRREQTFCSADCAAAARRLFADAPAVVEKICERCGTRFTVEPKRLHTARYCSRSCLAKAHLPQFQVRFAAGGSKRRPKTPYHQIMRNGKKVREHRYVMEQHLGRRL